MTRIISALILAVTATFCLAQEQPLQLADSAPNRYVVVAGDTLWDISAKFLKEPWRWPEIWRMNQEQIKNPHRIYPGEVLLLERDSAGKPYLRKGTVKLEPQIYATQNAAIALPPIPPNVIEPFISAPLIVEVGALNNAPRIIATQQERINVGNGDLAYVENADPSKSLWNVYRNGSPLFDPADGKTILGYEAFHLGTAKQLRPGQPATFEIQTAKQEIGIGNRLTPIVRPPLIDYVPRKPDSLIEGRIISIYGGIGSAGRGSIVSFNRGALDGIEIGHVLALERNLTINQRDENDRKISVHIPRARAGLLLVFRTFEHISYALVVQADGIIEKNDFVITP